MRDLLLEASRAVDEARACGVTALAPDLLAASQARYWEALREGLAYHRKLPRLPRQGSKRGKAKRRPGHNLLIRLHKFKDDVLRFLIDFEVPFTNNLAEQALRMMKVKMKISGAFRTFEGAQAFAALRSILATARKRQGNILETISENPNRLCQALQP
jgi:transposase